MKLGAKPRVLLADDHAPLQVALRQLLEPECELVGRAAAVSELLAEAHRWHPDVVVVDLLLPESDGIDACRQLKAALPAIRIVMLTAMDDADIRQAALAAGASDSVSKHLADQRLLTAIRNAWGKK
jgi:DNA-binding NarL/FixJ family response regulator